MDKRLMWFGKVIIDHQKLLDLYHTNPHLEEAFSSDHFKQAFLNFSQSFISLIDNLNPKADNFLFTHLFTSDINKRTLPAHLVCAREYLQDITQRFTKDHHPDYYIRTEIIRIIFDYLVLLVKIGNEYKIDGKFSSYGSRKLKVDSFFAFELAQKIFRGDHFLHQSLLEGTAIFTLRQSCELYSKEILRISKLKNSDGTPFLYGSSFPIKFLAEKKYSAHFNFSSDPSELLVIYKWSNLYVHTGKFSECYVVYKAIKRIEELYKLQKSENPINGLDFRSPNVIENYSKVQELFIEFINNNRKSNLLDVEWTPSLSRYVQYKK